MISFAAGGKLPALRQVSDADVVLGADDAAQQESGSDIVPGRLAMSPSSPGCVAEEKGGEVNTRFDFESVAGVLLVLELTSVFLSVAPNRRNP
jgi:hypothetical protein